MGPVEEMAWCQWEAAYVEAGHHCIGWGQTIPCPTPEGHPCGTCPSCLAAQEADLIRHGTPSDLDVPAMPLTDQIFEETP